MLTLDKQLLNEIEEMDSKQAFTLPASVYTESSFLAYEHQLLFENNWQLVGHKDQLSKPGDQIISQVGRVPIVVVMNEKHQLKAFHNVCRHRAGPVATENTNNKVLRCKYHGWTYNLDGDLRSAPEMQSTENFELCQYHLPEAKLDCWQGFIFVCIGEHPPPLKELFKGIVKTIHPIDISVMKFSHRDEFLIDCNWKVYMDNYLEGYHLPYVHPGLSKLLDYRSYDTILHQWHSYQFSPLGSRNSDDNFYGEGDAHYYCVFPNLMLNILPGRLQTNVILPEKEKTRVIFDYYYSDLDSAETKKLIQQDKEFSDEIQQEDIEICEQVQRGLNSGSYTKGRLCMKRETGVLHYQNLIRKTFRDAIKNNLMKIQ